MIGLLDLQGGVVEHIDHLKRIGIPCRSVKKAGDLKDLFGLIIPGGESTCMSRLMDIFDMKEAVIEEFSRGMKVWGTCAGAILLAKTIIGEAPYLGLIDIVVERNSFGSQLDSFATEAVIKAISLKPVPLIFIRAPKILSVGPGVNILLKIDDYIAAAESENALVTVFHPELTGCVQFHRYFAQKCGLDPFDESRIPAVDPAWNTKSWTRLVRITRS
jgi:pyridoxal 5'-phosphate synthase pdxT subunit